MSACVTCVTVRHQGVAHPLTCGNALGRADDAPQGASHPSDNDSQTVSLQVTASRLTKTCTTGRVRHTPLTHPLTCGNAPCVTNGHFAEPLRHNGIGVRHGLPLRGCARTDARATPTHPWGAAQTTDRNIHPTERTAR